MLQTRGDSESSYMRRRLVVDSIIARNVLLSAWLYTCTHVNSSCCHRIIRLGLSMPIFRKSGEQNLFDWYSYRTQAQVQSGCVLALTCSFEIQIFRTTSQVL